MRILAIDPGNEQSAFVVYDCFSYQIVQAGIMPNDELKAQLADNGCQLMAIEMIASYGMAVGKTVFDTCVWIGRFIEAWNRQHRLVYRMEEKMHLCHNSRAKDANIRQALIDKFGPQGTKKNPGKTYGLKADMWAALAVAVVAAETNQSNAMATNGVPQCQNV